MRILPKLLKIWLKLFEYLAETVEKLAESAENLAETVVPELDPRVGIPQDKVDVVEIVEDGERRAGFYRGTLLIRNCNPPQDRDRALMALFF